MTTALDVVAGLVLPDGRRWGAIATPAQRADAVAILGTDGPRRHWIGRARGYSKTLDAAGWTLGALIAGYLPAGPSGYLVAGDADQARLVHDSLAAFVRDTPGLASRFEVGARRLLDRMTGAEVVVLAADAASAYGIRPAWLICDELCQWPHTAGARAFFDAVFTSLPKVAGARAVIITTAGSPAHWARRVFDLAVAETKLWRVAEIAGPPPWVDAQLLAAERRRLPPSLYARLFDNEWVAAEDSLTNPDDLAACATLDGPLAYDPSHRYVIAVDAGVRHDAAVAVVAHGEAVWSDAPEVGTVTATRVVIDRLSRWRPRPGHDVSLTEVEEWLAASAAAYQAVVYADPWQMLGALQRLRARGVAAAEWSFTASSVGRLAATLANLISSHMLALPDDVELLDELAGVRLVERTPGVVRMDHVHGAHDDQATAIGLAATVLLEHPTSSSGLAVGILTGSGDSVMGINLDGRYW